MQKEKPNTEFLDVTFLDYIIKIKLWKSLIKNDIFSPKTNTIFFFRGKNEQTNKKNHPIILFFRTTEMYSIDMFLSKADNNMNTNYVVVLILQRMNTLILENAMV